MIAYKLTGSRCRCAGCGEVFNSVSVFARHRVGGWADQGAHRRCLTVLAMVRKGWTQNAAGFWIERPRARARTGLEIRRRLIDLTPRSGDLGLPRSQVAGCP